MAEVGVVGDLRERDRFGEPVERESVTNRVGVGQECFVAAIVFGGRADVVAFAAMGGKGSAL